MSRLREFVAETGIMVATTVGAGMFALPYVFSRSGWVAGLFYLLFISVVIGLIHCLYWEVLDKRNGREGLVGLAGRYLGKAGSGSAFFVVVGGLLLTLVAYLILGSGFLRLVFPDLQIGSATVLFWLISSAPLLFGLGRIVGMEVFGSLVLAGIIFAVFVSGWPPEMSTSFANSAEDLFLSFGPVLFALSAWTAVEPIYEFQKRSRSGRVHGPGAGLVGGTFLSAALYVLFVLGIFGSGAAVTPDAVSGLEGWSRSVVVLMAVLGLFAIWTSYVPIGLEIQNALRSDLGWPQAGNAALVFLGPPLLVFLGLNDFIRTIGLAGGIFLGLQHLLIIILGIKILSLSRPRALLFSAFAGLFVLAALYEIYYFVVG